MLDLAPLQISPGFWKHLTGFLVLWKEQCKKDRIERELGLDELRFLFNITNMVPRGQFYLRASNDMKFTVPGANVKYTVPWKEEWFVVEASGGTLPLLGGMNTPSLHNFQQGTSGRRGCWLLSPRTFLQGS